MSRNYRSSIPKGAIEIVEQSFANGAKEKAFFFLDGVKVGFRQWEDDGSLFYEYGIRNGKKHGREYRFFRLRRVMPLIESLARRSLWPFQSKRKSMQSIFAADELFACCQNQQHQI